MYSTRFSSSRLSRSESRFADKMVSYGMCVGINTVVFFAFHYRTHWQSRAHQPQTMGNACIWICRDNRTDKTRSASPTFCSHTAICFAVLSWWQPGAPRSCALHRFVSLRCRQNPWRPDSRVQGRLYCELWAFKRRTPDNKRTIYHALLYIQRSDGCALFTVPTMRRKIFSNIVFTCFFVPVSLSRRYTSKYHIFDR